MTELKTLQAKVKQSVQIRQEMCNYMLDLDLKIDAQRDRITELETMVKELKEALPIPHTLQMFADAPALHIHPVLQCYLRDVAKAISATIAKHKGGE